jgi:signal transduction histidine kinase
MIQMKNQNIMKQEFLSRYESILKEYLVHHGEDKLYGISELSKMFIKEGLGPEEMIETGKEVFERVIADNPKEQHAQIALDLMDLSIESMMPYGILYQELKELIEKLEVANQQLKKTNQELQDTHEQLIRYERLAAMGQLAAGVAHEVNNPLGIINLTTDSLMERLKDNELATRKLQTVKDQIARASEITRALLTFSRKQDEKQKALTDLNKLITETIEPLEHQLILNNVKIAKMFNESLPMIEINAKQIQQVILNLINNARDAMAGGGQITIKTYEGIITDETKRRKSDLLRDGQKVVLMEVADTGSGMTEEVKAKIFTPFFTTKAEVKGTGLGLSVSHGIIESHGGDIQVRSELNKGSAFIVRLPIPNVNSDFK